MLIEISEFLARADNDLPRARGDLAENQPKQRAFAASVRPDDADPITADDACREIANHRFITVAKTDAAHVYHELSGNFACVDAEPGAALRLQPLRSFTAQSLQRAHPPFVPRAPCFDPPPNPRLFLGQ